MQNITSTAGLKHAIHLLEVKQAISGQKLKEQFYLTCECLKPANLLKSTLTNISSSPNLIDTVLSTAIGLATGYLSKKIVVGASANIFRKLFGSMLQFGITKAVAQHPDAIKSFGWFIFQHFLHKKNGILKSHDR
jgi:hypothetical protein